MSRCSHAQRITFCMAMAATLAAPPVLASETSPQPDYTAGLRRTVLLDDGTPQRFSIEERMAHYTVPGVSIAVVEGCRIVDARGFGNATPAGAPVTVGTQFQVGSVSKVVTAAGALTLVDDGTLALDKDIAGYLQDWSLPRPAPYENASLTLRHLLTHSAGLNVAGFKGYPIGTPLPSLVQVLDGQAPANTEAVLLVELGAYEDRGVNHHSCMQTHKTREPYSAQLCAVKPSTSPNINHSTVIITSGLIAAQEMMDFFRASMDEPIMT